MKKRVSLPLLLLALISILTSSRSSATVGLAQSEGVGEWQIVTNHNFSSQIRLKPYILLFVTVPWSGEFRSLMKEVSLFIADKQHGGFNLSSLNLMYMYRNQDRVLADAIGVTEGEGMITVLYYHHSVSYKYSGKLRAFDILSSVRPYLSHELPIKTLKSEEDVKIFIESTDKAVILVEFCGWTSKLLDNVNNNGSENTGFLARGFRRERDRMMDKKVAAVEMERGKMQCGVPSVFGGIPWSADFSVLNDSDSENITSGDVSSCSTEEFRKFESFFHKFMTVARDFVLPLQRHRVGLVSDKSLLPSLGDVDPGMWSIMVYFNGCPSCTKILKDSDNLKGALQADGSIVMELEVDGQDLEPEIPADKASIVLLIDRASNSSETRRKSKEALDVYRELALQLHISDQKGSQYYDFPEKSPDRNYEVSKSTSAHPRVKRSPTVKKIDTKDKISFTIINNGKPVSLDNISPDLSAGNLHEILEGLLKREKTKLSALAKEVGFRLLSDDVDIGIVKRLPSLVEVESDQVSPSALEAPLAAKDQLSHTTSMNFIKHEEKSEVTSVKESSSHDEETRTVYDGVKNPSKSVEADQQILDDEAALAEDDTDKSGDQKLNFEVFKGPFFFSDGNYRLLRALTGDSVIPSLVIINSTSQQHYVLSKNAAFSRSVMSDFLQGFLNGSLLPYQQSEFIPQGLREAANPPFVNLDFHEVDSIPRVTTHTFTELVIGFNRSAVGPASGPWNEDVLVIFSNPWCGFCQRMELVVREVYRAVKGYMKSIKSATISPQTGFTSDKYTSVGIQVPSIYLFDCTLNDCDMILKSANQREVYPTLLLFPAENKNVVVAYNGDVSVRNVVKFIADYGSNSQHLIHEKGILRTPPEKGDGNQDLARDSSEKASHTTEILLKHRTPKSDVKHVVVKSHTSKSSPESGSKVTVGSILIATDKLLNASPFDKSQILIVKADHDIRFEGLILNKHINWDTFQELEQGLEFLKEASLSFGGPVMKKDMPLVALTRKAVKERYPEALPGVYFVDQLATGHKIELLKSGNHSSVTDYWFFLGYSTWGWDQLFHEISEGSWNITDAGDFVWPSKVTVLSKSDPLFD